MKQRISLAALLLVGAALLLIQCRGARGLDRRQGPEYQDEVQSWVQAIDSKAGNGMWLVSRGYHVGDDMVAIATNSPVSHASILDLEKRQVIEAVGKGVVVTDLDKFIHDTHRLIIIRPQNWTPDRGTEAVAKAREKVGSGYDYLGIVGAPQKSHFYCSELAAWSMGLRVDRNGPHRVLHPKDMHRYGAILFDSGERDGDPDFPN